MCVVCSVERAPGFPGTRCAGARFVSFSVEEVRYVSLTVVSPEPFAVPKFQVQSPLCPALPASFGRP